MTNKQTIINMAANFITYFSSILISFLLTPFLIDKLGKEMYSFYPIANTIVNYATIGTSALTTIATRFVVFNLAKKDRLVEAKKYFSASLICETMLCIFLVLIFTIIIVFIDKVLNVPIDAVASVRLLFCFMFSSVIVNVFSSVFGIATFAKNRIDLRSYRELASSVLRAGLSLLFYVFFPTSIVYIGIIALTVAIFSLFIQIMFTKKLLPGFTFNKEKPSKKHFYNLISSSFWTIVTSFGGMLLSGSPIILANIFYNETVSGIFSIAHTIPGFLGGIISLISGVFYPQLTYAIAENKIFEATNIIKKVEQFSGGLVMAIVSVFLGLSIPFFNLWVPSENSFQLFSYTCAAIIVYIPQAAFWIITYQFVIQNKVKTPGILTIVFGIINILICWIFSLLRIDPICIYLVSGALSFLLYGVLFPMYSNKILGINLKELYKPFIKCIVSGFVVFSLTFSVTQILTINSWIKFILVGAACGISGLLVIFCYIDFRIVIEYSKIFMKRISRKARGEKK